MADTRVASHTELKTVNDAGVPLMKAVRLGGTGNANYIDPRYNAIGESGDGIPMVRLLDENGADLIYGAPANEDTVVLLGDSTVNRNGVYTINPSDGPNQTDVTGVFEWYNRAAGSPFRVLANFGLSGYRSYQCIADPSYQAALALRPAYLYVGWGLNNLDDVGGLYGSNNLSQLISDTSKAIQDAKSIHAKALLPTLLSPNGNDLTHQKSAAAIQMLEQYCDWVRHKCATDPSCIQLDIYKYCINPLFTGNTSNSYYFLTSPQPILDNSAGAFTGLHPTNYGGSYLGQALAANTPLILPPASLIQCVADTYLTQWGYTSLPPAGFGDGVNVMGGGASLFQGSSGSLTLSTDITAQAGSIIAGASNVGGPGVYAMDKWGAFGQKNGSAMPTLTYAVVANDTGYPGNKQQIILTDSVPANGVNILAGIQMSLVNNGLSKGLTYAGKWYELTAKVSLLNPVNIISASCWIQWNTGIFYRILADNVDVNFPLSGNSVHNMIFRSPRFPGGLIGANIYFVLKTIKGNGTLHASGTMEIAQCAVREYSSQF